MINMEFCVLSVNEVSDSSHVITGLSHIAPELDIVILLGKKCLSNLTSNVVKSALAFLVMLNLDLFGLSDHFLDRHSGLLFLLSAGFFSTFYLLA